MWRGKGKGPDGQLQEPLLSQGAESSAAVQQNPPPQHHALIVHRPFSVEQFIQLVIESWLCFLRSISHCLQGLLWGNRASLTIIQAERLEELQERLLMPFDSSDPSHRDLLRDLWNLSFPDVPCTTLKTPKWKEMGWQGDDPGTDFRGAGLLGLDSLLYLGTHYPQLYHSLLHKTQGNRSDWEYPFAVAGLSLTFMLTEVLGIPGSKSGVPPATVAGQAFCQLLQDSDVAFEEVYCMTFALLDKVWLQERASYMQFNSVLKGVRGRLDAALRSKPRNLQQLRQTLFRVS